jgi:hypothetical protein
MNSETVDRMSLSITTPDRRVESDVTEPGVPVSGKSSSGAPAATTIGCSSSLAALIAADVSRLVTMTRRRPWGEACTIRAISSATPSTPPNALGGRKNSWNGPLGGEDRPTPPSRAGSEAW